MRKSSQKIIFLAFLFLAVIQQVFSATVGNPGGTYKTLKAAFDAINNGTLTGAVTLQIVDNTVEPLTATLNASGVGAANYTSVDIYPTVAGRSISMAAATSLINLNGADNVTIDGRVNKVGPADLTISSTNSSIGIPVSTIQFRNDASNNFVRYCKILGTPPINSISATILFTTGTTTGNNNNTIEYSYITNGRSQSPSILSVGSASIPNKNNVIRFNNFYDCWHAAWASEAILIGDNNDGWTINDNSFYETSNFIVSLPNIMNRFIEVNSLTATNISIIHNYFGGNAPKCTGILQKSGDHSYTQGIYIKAGTGTCKIKNNYFGNINWFNGNRSTDFYVYIIDKGSVSDIELVSNTIGSLDGTSSIQFINSDVQSSNFVGIYNAGSGNFVCDSNALGTINCDMVKGEQGNNIWGIQSDPAATGKIYIRNCQVSQGC